MLAQAVQSPSLRRGKQRTEVTSPTRTGRGFIHSYLSKKLPRKHRLTRNWAEKIFRVFRVSMAKNYDSLPNHSSGSIHIYHIKWLQIFINDYRKLSP